MSAVTKPPMLDETGKALVGAAKQIADAIANSKTGVVYGFHINGSESDPASKVTYLRDAIGATPAAMNFTAGTFSYGSWADAFFLPRPCMLKSNGKVDYYLNPNDYTKKADGTASDIADTTYDGNAMMEWGRDGKKIWMKIVPDIDHNGASVYIADHQADADFHDWPFHNSAGQSMDHFYTAIYNGSIVSNKMRSMSGQTVSKSKTANQEIAAAQLNNSVAANLMWNTELNCDITLINMLLILMGKSTNVQAVFGEGLHTGGNETINDGFTTGVHNAKGLFFGTNSGAISQGSYGNAVKVFGMENYWGFQWRRYQGHVMVDGVQKVKNTYGTEDGSTSNSYTVDGAPTGAGYKNTGAATLSGTSGDYIIKEHFTEDGMFPEGALGGSSSTYYCDACWYNNSGGRVPLRGGASSDGAEVGAFSVVLNTGASAAGWNIGAALSCKPLA